MKDVQLGIVNVVTMKCKKFNLVINVLSTFSCLAKVAIDSQGRGLVVWEHFRPNHQTIIEYRQINAGQALRGNNGVIETERPPYPPYLAMNSSGDAVIYWNENKPGPDPRNPGVNRDIVAVRYKPLWIVEEFHIFYTISEWLPVIIRLMM